MHKITSTGSPLCGGSVTHLTGRREYVYVGLAAAIPAANAGQSSHRTTFQRLSKLFHTRSLLIVFSLLWGIGSCWAGPISQTPGAVVKNVGLHDVLQWGLALLFVLAIFSVFVWTLRKLSGLQVTGEAKMRVLGGLSLGMREKVVLLEVGNKQLVLGVTPGRIQTLVVLEGEECLTREQGKQAGSNLFAQKLMNAMKGRSDG